MNLFVAGTDTSVGKTVIATALSLKLGWRYWKPIQSGTLTETDSAWSGRFLSPSQMLTEEYSLTQPLSPHLSAKLDGCEVSIDRLLARAVHLDSTVIEGAGGLLVPLNEFDLQIDFIEKLQVPVILVARSALGTINHTLLSIEALRSRSIELIGVVLVGPANCENAKAISKFGRVEILGQVPIFENLDLSALQAAAEFIRLPAFLPTSTSPNRDDEPLRN